jgi:tetratricopeptide (TPR) repeat protein
VARVLPLAEVLNNQGVALARRGLDGSALFRQAQVTDPNGADYHFNLAVSLKRHGDKAEALNELAQCLKLKPNDGEAVELEQSWSSAARSSAAKAPVVKPALGAGESPETAVEAKPKPDPLERIERSFDAVAFHQAALMVEAVEAQRLAQLRPQERAQKLAAQAREYLEHGLLLEAERLYQSALAADSRNPAAHAGLAEVRERTGDIQAARKEAVTSLQLMPSVEAYMVLGRLDLAAGHMDQVIYETGEALKIDPKNQQVLALKQQIEDRKERK